MKIKWKIVLGLDILLLSIIILTSTIVNINITDLVKSKTEAELKNYSQLGLTLMNSQYPGDWRLDGD